MIKFVVVSLSVLVVLSATPNNLKEVYDLTQIVHYGAGFSKAFGCQSPNSHQFALGTYTVREGGLVDALNIKAMSWQLQVQTECLRNKATYSRLFGPDEDYQILIKNGAQKATNDIKGTSALNGKNLIIDWKYDQEKKTNDQISNSLLFLKEIAKGLENNYIRFPAASLCSHQAVWKEIENTKGFIVQMFGKDSNYQDFDSIFMKTDYPNEKAPYSSNCPRSPSYAKIHQILGGKPFFISKTLNQHIKGYVWNFSELLQEAIKKPIPIDRIFYDDFYQNMIRI